MTSEHKDKQYITHIVSFSESAIQYCEGMNYQEFEADQKTIHAVSYCVQTIGEATAKLSEEAKKTYPNVPWREIKAMRNILVHMYHNADPVILWKTVRENLPELLEELKRSES